jgi:hypothetical protein
MDDSRVDRAEFMLLPVYKSSICILMEWNCGLNTIIYVSNED